MNNTTQLNETERWDRADELMADLLDAGFDIIYADAIHVLDRHGWDVEVAYFAFLDEKEFSRG